MRSTGIDPQQFLRHAELFTELADRHLRSLAAICVPRRVTKKELLFHEGDPGLALYVAALGKVRLFKTTGDGKEVVIRIIKPGEVFAEVVLFEAERYPVSAMALEEGIVFLVSRTQFLCLLADEGFRNEFIAMLMRRQRYLVERIHGLSIMAVAERFFMFLRQHYGERQTFTLDLPRKELASAIGTTPETLSRLLLKLKEDGSLAITGDQATLRPGFWQEWSTRG